MKTEDKFQFKEMLEASWGLYEKALTKGILNLFWESLKKYDIEEISAALSRHTVNPDNGQFAPKPADIVRYIEGSGDDVSLKAWTKVEEVVRRKGAYVEKLIFDDPIIHAVLRDMGGWAQICASPSEEDFKFRGIEFCKRYRGAMNNNNLNYPTHLKGLIADGEEPLLIGDTAKAEKVALGGNDTPLRMAHVSDLMMIEKDSD
jgi:hypothetical protein